MMILMNRSIGRHGVRVTACIVAGVLWLASSTAMAQSVSGSEVLDLEQAAELLRVKPEVVRALAESQRIPARRVGDVWRFWHAALLDWLKGDAAVGAASELPQRASGLERTEMPQRELADVSARGLGQEPPVSPPLPPPAAMAQTSSTPPTVGERPATPTTADIALRDQRVLLGRGAATLDFGTSYGRTGQSLFPVVRSEEKAYGVSGTLRYGLVDDLQLTVRVPATWRRTATFEDATVTGTGAPSITTVHQGLAGDASVSLMGVASREAVGRPAVVWSLDGVVPTGAGDRGVGGGFIVSKTYDPAVLFAGLTYLYGLHTNPADLRWSLARHNIGFQVGYTYAVNDTLALSTAFLGNYRTSVSPDGIAIPPARENYALQLGTTWMLSRGVFMAPSVAMSIGGDNPGLSLSLTFSRALRWRSAR
jgi:excisionase family DNA binding protein